MAGIYIHVPFCKKKCHYCDFYSIGLLGNKDEYTGSVLKEIELRKHFIADETIETIYFGGGTPSLLSIEQIALILKNIYNQFRVTKDAEITLEANPDDLSIEILLGYKKIGINRLSIGVQSFIDNELKFLGRRHDSSSALESIEFAKTVGFDNISIDLIYGLPESTIDSWKYSLEKAFSLRVNHLSCYHLTYEEGTPIFRKLAKKQFNEIDEELSVNQFDLLRKLAVENGFVHYEVSNLAKEGSYSKHNTSYWKGVSYLGVGPSAHSYNGKLRQWNPKSYNNWLTGIESGKLSIQEEVIDKKTKFNEILLTRLRTIWGVDIIALKKEFGELIVSQLLKNCDSHLKAKRVIIEDNYLIIPPQYFFISDGIISDLLWVD
ncbi:MAG: radical SAM family heme chaperone HemW [Tenuifilaceae bacterium]